MVYAQFGLENREGTNGIGIGLGRSFWEKQPNSNNYLLTKQHNLCIVYKEIREALN
jgi:hypothetical protein